MSSSSGLWKFANIEKVATERCWHVRLYRKQSQTEINQSEITFIYHHLSRWFMTTFYTLNAARISWAINIKLWICKHTSVYGKSGNTTSEHHRRRGEMEITIEIFLRRRVHKRNIFQHLLKPPQHTSVTVKILFITEQYSPHHVQIHLASLVPLLVFMEAAAWESLQTPAGSVMFTISVSYKLLFRLVALKSLLPPLSLIIQLKPTLQLKQKYLALSSAKTFRSHANFSPMPKKGTK